MTRILAGTRSRRRSASIIGRWRRRSSWRRATAASRRRAREILLDEVILPYNRLLGQRKIHDSLDGFGGRAEEAFTTRLSSTSGLAAEQRDAAIHVFRALLETMEIHREGSRHIWGDSRLVWIPLHYALRLEDHETQDEIDALLERATGEELTAGNDVHYVINEMFQPELARMILRAEDYHVLWIHDFRGVNAAGEPDLIAYRQTVEAYLQALTLRARAFDEAGKMPAYMVFLDQFYYSLNQGWIFLELLENPLEHEIDLPSGYEEWERTISEAQDVLREAVAASAGLQEGAERHGKDWLRQQVKVHVNITNPPDFSFRSSHLLPKMPFLPDLLLRDHRKISFFDVTELDPGRGEALFTGVGVGEHYAGPTWEDRALLLRGPALERLKDAARELLLSQGFATDEIPAPLRPIARPDDYAQQVEALTANGWRAHAMQVHNATGYGPKGANIVKAVLYELMPAGSHLYIPDSLWNSPFWGRHALRRGAPRLQGVPRLAGARQRPERRQAADVVRQRGLHPFRGHPGSPARGDRGGGWHAPHRHLQSRDGAGRRPEQGAGVRRQPRAA